MEAKRKAATLPQARTFKVFKSSRIEYVVTPHTDVQALADEDELQFVLEASELPQGIKVGNKDWWAVTEGGGLAKRVGALEQEVAGLKGDVQVLAVPLVRNAAAQALLFACGDQPRPASEQDRFAALLRDGDTRLTQFLDEAGLTPAWFAKRADDMIARRNETLHFRGLAGLREEVERALGLAGRHVGLRKVCKDEFVVLDNLDALVSSFNLA